MEPGPQGSEPSSTQTIAPPGSEPRAGEMFAGRYRLIEEIGRGGMGRVFKAFDTDLQDSVALKFLRPAVLWDSDAVSRFKSEIKQARLVSHPNVGRVFDWGESAGVVYLSMEFVPGQTLKTMIRQAGRLDTDTAVAIARQIGEGLAEAHRLGIVHRDMKPQNIIITPDGAAKIMDFGIARSGGAPDLTQAGAIIGTPEYMAPEQAGRAADVRSDLYALGVILYEMVTGRVPFPAETPLGAAWKHKTEEPRSPRQTAPGLSSGLDKLILKCLEKDPQRRFQNASEFLDALNAVHPADAGSSRPPFPKRKGKPRPFVIAGLGAGLIVAIIVLWAVLGKKPWREEGRPTGGSVRSTIAVLPFEDLSPDHSLAAHCEGLADDLRTRLSGSFDVISKYSSDRIKTPDKDALDFIKGLNVEYYLEGAFRLEESGVKANIKVSDARTGFQRWTRSYEIRTDAFFSMEDAIAREAAEFLGGGEAARASGRREPANLKSYFFCQWGRYYEDLYVKLGRDGDFAEAVRNFESAVKADGGNAKGYWGLGNLYEQRYAKKSAPRDLETMLGYYQRAFDIDPALPEARLGLGWAHYHQRKPEEAYRNFKDAFGMAPNNADVDFAVGALFRSLGLYEQALPYYERAVALSPLDSRAYFDEAGCCWYLGDYEKAENLLKQALTFESATAPATARLHLNLARQFLSLGRLAEAEHEIGAAEKLQLASDALTRHKVWLAAARGDRAGALALLRSVERPYLYEITNAYCLLKMTREAVRNIREGIEEAPGSVHDEAYVYPFLTANPLFRGLRDDSDFRKILAGEKTKHEAKLKNYPSF